MKSNSSLLKTSLCSVQNPQFNYQWLSLISKKEKRIPLQDSRKETEIPSFRQLAVENKPKWHLYKLDNLLPLVNNVRCVCFLNWLIFCGPDVAHGPPVDNYNLNPYLYFNLKSATFWEFFKKKTKNYCDHVHFIAAFLNVNINVHIWVLCNDECVIFLLLLIQFHYNFSTERSIAVWLSIKPSQRDWTTAEELTWIIFVIMKYLN